MTGSEAITAPGPRFEDQCDCLMPKVACVCPEKVDWGFLAGNVGKVYEAKQIAYDSSRTDWFDSIKLDDVIAWRIQHFFTLSQLYPKEGDTLWMKQMGQMQPLESVPYAERDKLNYKVVLENDQVELQLDGKTLPIDDFYKV